MQHLTAKQRQITIAKDPSCYFYNERPDILDALFNKFVIKDIAYGKVIPHYPRNILSLNLQPHVILETPKHQIIL